MTTCIACLEPFAADLSVGSPTGPAPLAVLFRLDCGCAETCIGCLGRFLAQPVVAEVPRCPVCKLAVSLNDLRLIWTAQAAVLRAEGHEDQALEVEGLELQLVEKQFRDWVASAGPAVFLCPRPDCKGVIDVSRIDPVGGNTDGIESALDNLTQLTLDGALQRTWAVAMIVDECDTVMCVACSGTVCRHCHEIAHPASSCAALDEHLDRFTAVCPGCNRRVQKEGGCRNMHCKCGASWTWEKEEYQPDAGPVLRLSRRPLSDPRAGGYRPMTSPWAGMPVPPQPAATVWFGPGVRGVPERWWPQAAVPVAGFNPAPELQTLPQHLAPPQPRNPRRERSRSPSRSRSRSRTPPRKRQNQALA